MNETFGICVSIPHRYDPNCGWVDARIDPVEVRFQFLIGTIQTQFHDLFIFVYPSRFQFLIGTIQTYTNMQYVDLLAEREFQFLIGTIQT